MLLSEENLQIPNILQMGFPFKIKLQNKKKKGRMKGKMKLLLILGYKWAN